MPNPFGAALALLALAVLFQAPAYAQADQTLRDELRQTTLQLRSMQDENAALKAKLQSLTQRVELMQSLPQPAPAVEKKAAPDASAALRSALSVQKQKAEDLQQQLDAARQSREQWQTGYQKAVAVAQERDGAAKKFEALYQDADTQRGSCETKNGELVNIGNEVIARYENKGVWNALADAEPLTQIHKVRLQQLTQEYRAKVKDSTVVPVSESNQAEPESK